MQASTSVDGLCADLWATHRFPTDEEAERIIREGSHEQIAGAMVLTCCSHRGLRLAYAAGRREYLRPRPPGE